MTKPKPMTEKQMEYARENLSYNANTGIIIWIKSPARCIKIGSEAGSLNRGSGYRQIELLGRNFRAHRLAWFLYHGNDPLDKQIDHIDQNRVNNNIKNLRLVTHRENSKNRKKRSSNTSGITGVSWYKAISRWQVKISINGKNKHLGYCRDFFDACCTRKSAEITHGYHENHGS